MDHQDTSFVVRTEIGPYVLLRLLGQGGMGVVHLAKNVETGEKVALKTLTGVSPQKVRSLLREIVALKSLRHPHIVRILDEGVTKNGVPWYAMEFVRGTPLDEVFRGGADVLATERIFSEAEHDTLMQTNLSPPAGILNQTESEVSATHLFLDNDENLSNRTFDFPQKDSKVHIGPPNQVPLSNHFEEPNHHFDDMARFKLRLLAQVAHALAYMHGRGLVHCDLKPENILVTMDGRAILADFGLVANRSEVTTVSVVEEAGVTAGTVLYLAPERILGQNFDARLDLYALGCLFFEAIANRPAFLYPTAYESLSSKLSGEIPSVKDHIDGVPQALISLTTELMALIPEQRPSSALSVIARLRAAGIDGSFQGNELPKPKPHIYPAALIGRDETLKACILLLQQAFAGQTQFLMLQGESGAGKSRLASEIVREARRKRIEILVGQCQVMQGRNDRTKRSPTMGAFARILEFISQRAETVELADKWFGSNGKVLAQLFPELRNMPGQDRFAEVGNLDVHGNRLRLFQAVESVLTSYLNQRPSVLVFEDLQWADELSIRTLTYLQRSMTRERWLIIGTYRSDEIFEDLADFVNLKGVNIVNVERFPAALCQTMLISMLGTKDVPNSLSEFVTRHSSGNPFFLVTCLQAAVEEGFLGLDELGNWTFDALDGLRDEPMPTTLTKLVARRLEMLSPDLNRFVQAASVIGREVDLNLLLFVTELEDANSILENLVAREIFEYLEMKSSYQFVHDQLVEITYAELEKDPKRCADLHRLVAQYLTNQVKAEREIELGRLAWHLEASQQADEARLVYFKASRQAADKANHFEAEEFLERGLQLSKENDEESLMATLLVTEEVMVIQGRMKEAEDRLNKVLEISSSELYAKAHAEALRAYGFFHLRKGSMEEAQRLLEQARVLFCHLGDRLGEGKCIGNSGIVLLHQGNFKDAFSLFLEALSIEREFGFKRGTIAWLGYLGQAQHSLGFFKDALSYYTEALEIAKEVSDNRAQGILNGNVGVDLIEQGRFAEAFAYLEMALEFARKVGDRHNEGVWLGQMGHCYQNLGNFEEAYSSLCEAIEIFRELGYKRGVGAWLSNLSSVNLHFGRTKEAFSNLDSALEIACEVGDKQNKSIILFVRGAAHIHLGNFQEALNSFDASLAIASILSEKRIMGSALTQIARVQRMCGEPKKAKDSLREAEVILRDLGSQDKLLECLCQWGHLKLYGGEKAIKELEEARSILASLSLPPTTELGKLVAKLERAIKVDEQGGKLCFGQCIEDYPHTLWEKLA